MTLVTWDDIGDRIFEAGCDRGVLYPTSGPGVPWNGLVSIDSKSAGDAPKAYYYDGIKYLQMPSPTDFEATLKAYTWPDEFDECDGSGTVMVGMLVTEQPPKQFGLAYRTRIGNDIEGVDLGYKLHLVYNALARPSQKTYNTLGAQVDPSVFAWDISTTPITTPGFKPGAHFIFDSRKISAYGMEILEGILYGAEGDPRLPLPEEIIALPFADRPIWVIATLDEDLLPPEAEEGDLVFVVDEEAAYCIGPTPTPYSRDVWILEVGDVLPEEALPLDLVYYPETGLIYRYEGD